MENRISGRRRRLIEIERKRLPFALHRKSVKHAEKNCEDPPDRPHKAFGRKLDRLVVEDDGSLLQRARRKGSLQQPKGGAENRHRDHRKRQEQANL